MSFNMTLLLSLLALTTSAQPRPFKTTCVSWAFHGFTQGTDVEPAIDTVAQLGFDGIQLMICQPSDIDKLWTDAKIERVKKKLADRQLELVSLVPFFTCYPNLGSSDPEKVKADLVTFEKCCVIARKLGARHLEMLGPFVSEFLGEGGYANNPFFFYKIGNDRYKPGDKLTLKSPPDIDWAAIEKRTLRTISACSKIAKQHGLELVIEPHYHSIIPDNNGFLRFWDKLKDLNILAEMDTGWGMQQVEYPPMVVYRTGKHLRIMQFRDVDNMTRDFVPMGQGVVNIPETLRALRAINFRGYVSFEEVSMRTAKEDARRFLALVNQ